MSESAQERRIDPERTVLTLDDHASRALNRFTGGDPKNVNTAAFTEGEEMRALVKAKLDAIDADMASRAKQKGELTPEQAQETLRTFEARFQINTNLHEGVNFEDVRRSLEANPEVLWSIAQMEAKGHEPDVYNTDDKGFDIGTCSAESPESARNCVYDKKAADYWRHGCATRKFNGDVEELAYQMGVSLRDPNLYEEITEKKGKFDEQVSRWLDSQKINGSAVEMAQAMGIDLMDRNLCMNVLKEKGKFDMKSSSWILKNPGDYNSALIVDGLHLFRLHSYTHDSQTGFRGSIRCPWSV